VSEPPQTRLAVNYSPQAAALARSGATRVDCFKCPSWPDLISEARGVAPIYVHFDLALRGVKSTEADWDGVARLMDETGTQYVNLHVLPRRTDFPGIAVDSAVRRDVVVLRDHLLVEIDPIVARFGATRVIIENAPYRAAAGGILRPAIAPELFTEILERTGCGLLLDIAHAAITARALSADVRQYLAEMPTGRLIELHMSGVRHDGERWRDHMGMTPDDWTLLDWSLEQIRDGRWARPWMLTYEYGGVGPVFDWRTDPAVLEADLPRFRQRLADGESRVTSHDSRS
jgi:hypothetical protein